MWPKRVRLAVWTPKSSTFGRLPFGCGHALHVGVQEGRCVVVHEATRFSGYGAELVATVQKVLWNLEARFNA